MADTPDTPKTDADKPTTRRRAPRATTTRKAPTVTKAPSAKAAAAKAPAAKPEPAPKAAKTVKPRSTKRATPRPSARTASAKSTVAKATDKVGGKWGLAAIAGGVAATGATLAALLTLRGSTPKTKPVAKPKGKGAHQPDGTDSSKSFEAGIADENTIPE